MLHHQNRFQRYGDHCSEDGEPGFFFVKSLAYAPSPLPGLVPSSNLLVGLGAGTGGDVQRRLDLAQLHGVRLHLLLLRVRQSTGLGLEQKTCAQIVHDLCAIAPRVVLVQHSFLHNWGQKGKGVAPKLSKQPPRGGNGSHMPLA